ncbi:Pentatricopeptide repeat-containing protein [Forsythia ovata]|uniref:Pentatricopeptide repeat-containing protein n=1 Tax=Forsythia ovata TaxID=205694 RepID=A0ABD1WAY6_9LAMI
MNALSSGLPKLLKESTPLHLENIASSLETCSNINLLKKLHACIFTRGLEGNIFLGFKLVKSYAKFNLLKESKLGFDKIIYNNISLWNSVIVGYFRGNHSDELLRLYIELRQKNVGVHRSALTFGLKSCVELGTFEFGRAIHMDGFKFGLSNDQFVGSSLIGFYSKFDHIEEAAKVFEEIINRDVVSYTSIITGYAHAGDLCAYEAFRMACHMQWDGIEPNRVTLISLLQATSHLRALGEGKSIHGYGIRRGIGCLDEVFETSLMDMYIKCGDPNKAAAIFEKMDERTIGSWNALIACHLQLGQPSKALDLFSQMVEEKCEPDLITLANGLLSCANLGNLLKGKSIHCYILRSGIQLDLVATTNLIDMYSKCKHLTGASEIFNRSEDKDAVLFNVMIAAYQCNGFPHRAMETFFEMVMAGVRQNISTILSVLSSLSDMEDSRGGKCVHGCVLKLGFEANTEVANQLINMYAKCGFIGCARRVFDTLKIKDTVSWTSLIMCYVHHNLAHEAMTLFRLMLREKLHLDSVTLTSVLQALNQLGMVSLAREVHCYMYRISVEKDIPIINTLITTYSRCGKLTLAVNLFEHMAERHLSSWNTMIAAFGTHGDCVRALKLFDQMRKEKVTPDEVTFTSVLSACSHSGSLETGLCIFWSMEKDYGVVPSEEHYGCVVDLLGRAGQLEEAYNVLKCLPSRQSASALRALLAACRVHFSTAMGERIGRWLLDMDPQHTSIYCAVSNMYAGGGKWDDVARIGAIAEGKGLKRTPGYSLVDFC